MLGVLVVKLHIVQCCREMWNILGCGWCKTSFCLVRVEKYVEYTWCGCGWGRTCQPFCDQSCQQPWLKRVMKEHKTINHLTKYRLYNVRKKKLCNPRILKFSLFFPVFDLKIPFFQCSPPPPPFLSWGIFQNYATKNGKLFLTALRFLSIKFFVDWNLID